MLEWVIMSKMENFLPDEYRFETTVAEMYEPLVESLAECAESGDVIDLEAEFAREYTELWELSRTVTELLKSDTENFADVQAATYRGLSFGLQIVNDIISGPINKHLAKYVQKELLAHGDDMTEHLQADVQQYLAERPAIDGLIAAFMPEIDGAALCNHHAETAAGLMFMVCEREQAEHYLQVEVETLSIDSLKRHRYHQSE